MPISWSYFLKDYLKTFFLCISAFILILLLTRSQEIARFATICHQSKDFFKFIFNQTSYVLPFAIPISGLIASYLLSSKLSLSFEITALRSSGFTLGMIQTPLILCASLLCCINYFLVSEVTPLCKASSLKLLHRATMHNPLILFKKNKFLKIKDTYADITLTNDDTSANRFLFAFKDQSSKRISLVLADKLSLENKALKGANLSIISTLRENLNDQFDDLLIESDKQFKMDAKNLASILQKPIRSLHYEQLPTKLLRVKKKAESSSKKSKSKANMELLKRGYFLLLPLCFTILGFSYGLKIGRKKSSKAMRAIVIFSTICFMGYLSGKATTQNLPLAVFYYFAPQIALLFYCFLYQKQISKGVER